MESLKTLLPVSKIHNYASELRDESTTNFRNFCELQTKENDWSLTNRLPKESRPRRPPTTMKETTHTPQMPRTRLKLYWTNSTQTTPLTSHPDITSCVSPLTSSPTPKMTSPSLPKRYLRLLMTWALRKVLDWTILLPTFCLSLPESFPILLPKSWLATWRYAIFPNSGKKRT